MGYVNDFADVIPAEREAQIARIVEEVQAKSGGEIVVVTLASLAGRTRDEVALEIGRQWKVGRKGEPGDPGRNTGAVVLVVPKETSPDGRGHVKIETGLGTSTFLTAAEAGRIADDHMLPRFREGDYGTGILHGVGALAAAFAERFGFELTGEAVASVPPEQGREGSLSWILFLLLIFIILMLGGGSRRRRRGLPFIVPFPMGGRHRGGWGGFGGGLGGFGGFGGRGGGFGGFGGGGGFG
ncbi:MAG: TPM domain-containing protein, partial [Gemmatimonadetes bacterium]|nr:TPM domain-containing protein [Gemmatimonadota bacterium]